MAKVVVPAHFRSDGTPVRGYTYDRTHWKTTPEGGRSGKGLRDAQLGDPEETPPLSQLPAQQDYGSTKEVALGEQNAVNYAMRRVPKPFLYDALSKVGAGLVTAIMGSVVAVAGFPLAVVPMVGLLGVGLAAPPLRRWWAARRARTRYRDTLADTKSRQYLAEAKESASRFPHWYGEVPEVSFASKNERLLLPTVEVTSSVDKNGVGHVRWGEKFKDGSGGLSGEIFLYPGAKLNKFNFQVSMALPGVNLRGVDASHSLMRGIDLISKRDKSMLDGADLRDADLRDAWWVASLRHANLAGADARGARLGDCDMDGVDLTGARVDGAQLPADLTNTNITREQFDSLAAPSSAPYRVREVSVRDVVAVYGGDEDAAAMALWSGDIEVRKRATSEVVVGEFNVDEHYIPHWAFDRSVAHK